MAATDTPTVSLSSPSTSSHRLPTVSGSQALHGQQRRAVPTGLAQLNRSLSPHGLPGRPVSGGYMRGKVTEIFGPSGVGKTAFGIQAAASALRDGHGVVWVDAACAPLVPQRFNDVLRGLDDDDDSDARQESTTSDVSPPKVPRGSVDELRSHFHHYTAPTLAHLLALLVHPPSAFPPPNTALIVIDSLSTLLDNAYPRSADDRAAKNRSDQGRWAASRKFAVINELISTLARIAALHDIALLATSQTITRIRAGSRALLVPAISGAEWENGISTRMVLFRDWVPGQGKWTGTDATKLQKARFIGVLKANGVSLTDDGGVGNVVPFTVESTGLCDIDIAAADIAAPLIPPGARPPKRRFADMVDNDGEHVDPDSDELYGWVEDDEVAAEGLLIDETHMTDGDAAESGATPPAASSTDNAAEEQRKVTRPATL